MRAPRAHVVATSTDTWAAKAPMPTARAWLAAGALNGVLYAVGGEVKRRYGVKGVEEFDAV